MLIEEHSVEADERAETALAAASMTKDVFATISPDKIRLQSRHAKERQRAGISLGSIDGMLVSIKDLFDVQGEVTRAGSRLFDDAAPATRDAEAVARLRRAGAILFGRTTMPELAFSGLGLNPIFGTPANPTDPKRIPGGSTAGGAASVGQGIVDAALGSDTSGSVRIPAAFCGLVGFKPSQGLIPVAGATPLAPSLDTVGLVTRDVEVCARAFAALGGGAAARQIALSSLRFLDLANTEQARDPRVSSAFKAALSRLAGAGARIRRDRLPAADMLEPITARGGFVAAEAFAIHRAALTSHGDRIEPFTLARLRAGANWTGPDLLDALRLRRDAQAEADAVFSTVDFLIAPTVACVAPLHESLSSEASQLAVNRLAIRDTCLANVLNMCAISLPMIGKGAPAGLMIMGRAGDDLRLLAIALAVAPLVQGL